MKIVLKTHSLPYFWNPFKASTSCYDSLIRTIQPIPISPHDSNVNSAAKTGRFWISYDDSLTERKDHTSQRQKEYHVCYSPVLRYAFVAALTWSLLALSWIFRSHSKGFRLSVSHRPLKNRVNRYMDVKSMSARILELIVDGKKETFPRGTNSSCYMFNWTKLSMNLNQEQYNIFV